MSNLDPITGQPMEDGDLYSQIVGDMAHGQRAIVDDGLESNPDDAAESLNLSAMTGDPAPAIMANLDEYKDNLRRQTAMQLVLNNPELVTYLQSHPMSAAVSNDDWGNLDQFSQDASTTAKLHQILNAPFAPVSDAIGAALKALGPGFAEGFGAAPLGQQSGELAAEAYDPDKQRLGWAAATAGLEPGELLLRTMSGLAMGATSAAEAGGTAGMQGLEKLTGLNLGAEGFGRELGAMTEWSLMRGDMPLHGPEPIERAKIAEGAEAAKHEEFIQQQARLGEAMAAGKPWIEAGMEPPAGLNPLIDEAKAKLNSTMLESMERDLENAQASLTKARSPGMFQQFVTQHFGESTFDIHSDAVLGLYGDKVPEAGDGLLGWVPDIQTQLSAAREIGTPVQVKIADWLANVDPQVAKGLRDDIRMWPGGITANEAKEPIPPKQVIGVPSPGEVTVPPPVQPTMLDGPLPQVRDVAGLEPKFSMGDRKLSLVRGEPSAEAAPQFEGKLETLNMHDENGQQVGQIEIAPGTDKTLYVNWIGGQAGLWANNFGPALMRDLKRQLKGLYPDYEYLTGNRVSGAREGGPLAGELARVKLSADEPESVETHRQMQDIFDNGWQRFTNQTEINVQPKEFYTPEELAAGQAAYDEIQRITGGKADVQGVAGIKKVGSDQTVRGLYKPYADRPPTILYDLLGQDPTGIGRHEAIHYLRDNGFFKPAEWSALEKAATEEGWMDRYGIGKRYGRLGHEEQLEEAIAEGFREWAAQPPESLAKTRIGAIFQKLMDFLSRVKQRMGETLGREPTWQEVFQRTSKGEVGKRGPGAPLTPGAFDMRGERFSNELEGIQSRIQARERAIDMVKRKMANMSDEDKYNDAVSKQQGRGGLAGALANHEQILADLKKEEARLYNRENLKSMGATLGPKFAIEGSDNLRAQSVGLDLPTFQKLQNQIRKAHEEDIKSAQARAEKEQVKRQTKEWKSNWADVAKEVSADINQRPDIAADNFIGSGELFGRKLRQRYTMRTEDFTPEQLAAMPEHYTSKNGLPADQVAGMFGYGSRDELAQALSRVTEMRKDAEGDRLGKGTFMQQLVRAETDRRMEVKYGRLQDNIMEAATEQALGETHLNLMYEELTAAAMRTGSTVFDKVTARAAAKALIEEFPIRKVSSYRLLQEMGKHSRDAEKALINNDGAAAVVSMQKQYVTALVAKEAKAIEKEIAQFDKTAKRMSKREVPSMEPEYTNWVHQILTQVGKKVQRTPEDLAREIQASGSGDTLEEFVNNKTMYGQVLPVWDQLFDSKWSKPYKDLLVPEFRGVSDSVRTLIHNGREERKLIRAGNEADRAEAITQLVGTIADQFEEHPMTMEGEKHPPGFLRHTWARLLTVQTILNRWDKFDWKGPWQQMFYRPLSEGANQAAAWEKEMAKTFREITNRPAVTDKVPNTVFRNPINNQFSDMTRENLRAVLLYMGSESGMDKLAKGYKADPAAIKQWAFQHMTKEDLDFVNGIWAAMEKPRGWSDTMYRSMSDVPMQGIEPVPMETPHGTLTGGYVPIRYHQFFEGKSSKLSGIGLDGLFGKGYSTGFAPDATYKIERTGYAAPLDLTLDRLVPAVKQQIRDAALRPALANASKILRDPQVAAAIKSRYGSEYHEMLKEYLRRLANTENRGGPQGQYTKVAQQVMEFARQNLIADLVGFNPGTVMKHGATAFVLSAKEVGAGNMLRAMRQLYEINPETGQTWKQFAYENSQELQRRHRNWQENLYGSTTGDEERGWFAQMQNQFSEWGSKPIAMADALSSEPTWLAAYTKERDAGGSHGDGIAAGDVAVQRAHGSTSAAAQPLIMSHLNPWVTSLYNFFNDILNRAVETMWKAGKMVDAVKESDWESAGKLAPGVAAGMFATVIWPAVVEQLVSPGQSQPGESTAEGVMKGSIHSVAAMFPLIRDFAEYVTGSGDPNVGLASTQMKALGEAWKDFGKKAPFSPVHAQKMIRDFGTMIGAVVGAPGMQIGREASFAYGLATGTEHPRGPWGWAVGMRYGTIRGHSPTLQDYMAGRSLPNR